ncbi:hypothetical protein PQR39_35715 [Paraburkholderia sediminicola]|uniref:hypothetical protein n=1 Tax=Paraburkholderia sediminicola TaxID=458836 RepID=UPI0038B7EB76
MADTPTTETAEVSTAAAAVAAPAAPATTSTAPARPAHKVSLEHFATRLSATDKRVALIYGWVNSEKRTKKFRDLPANYQARYAAFANKPITQ